MGGAPGELLYDRMKTAVIGEDAEGLVSYNVSLVALLNHYGALPRACRPYRAKTKGKVERPYRYIRKDFFLGRTFRDLDDLNRQFEAWRVEIANARVHATTRRIVGEHFAEERPALIAHPAIAYSGAHRRAADQPRGHGLGGRQSLERPARHPEARRRGPEPSEGGLPRDAELPAQCRHRLPFQPARDETQTFFHDRTLSPRHPHLPPRKAESVTHVSGTFCHLCPRPLSGRLSPPLHDSRCRSSDVAGPHPASSREAGSVGRRAGRPRRRASVARAGERVFG
jgi:hypothetical protein